MSSVDKAIETQLKNIQTKTKQSLEQLCERIRESGLAKHGEIREMLKRDLSMGHGDANAITHYYFKSTGEGAAGKAAALPGDVLDEIYAGPKAELRPIHAETDGGDHQVRSLRDGSQEGLCQPATQETVRDDRPGHQSRVELGLNMKGVPATSRLAEMPAGGMCQYKVKITDAKEVDEELIAWIRQAYDSAGKESVSSLGELQRRTDSFTPRAR